jgi:hypothetical protein
VLNNGTVSAGAMSPSSPRYGYCKLYVRSSDRDAVMALLGQAIGAEAVSRYSATAGGLYFDVLKNPDADDLQLDDFLNWPVIVDVTNEAGMTPHMTGSTVSGKSQFLFAVDANRAVLDAAAYADREGLWIGSKAKVFILNGPVGVLGDSGGLTDWLNVYRTRTGFVHGAPGSPP